jgi:hypothetical protein
MSKIPIPSGYIGPTRQSQTLRIFPGIHSLDPRLPRHGVPPKKHIYFWPKNEHFFDLPQSR